MVRPPEKAVITGSNSLVMKQIRKGSGVAAGFRRSSRTMSIIVRHSAVFLAGLLALRAAAGVAPWYFLPNFGEDVRGVERGRVALPRDLPTEAERLLSPDGGLTPDQREQVRWHEATFPQ